MSDPDTPGNPDETSAPREPLPKKIGRYEIQRELGRGMMGLVYEAYDTVLGRAVALKTIKLAFVVTPAEAESFEQRFFTEARIASRLSHPGIVVVHDVGKDAETGVLYIVLEYLQGRTLAEMTAGHQPLYWRDALQITSKLARALHHAHSHGVVHRDIKPANVLVLDNGEPKILDFGIAKIETARIKLTTAGQSFGSPLFMSPEQAQGTDVVPQSDLFSLGSILYTLLTGHSPFHAPSIPAVLLRICKEDPLPPSLTAAGLPNDVDAIAARALAKQPADRYPNGQMMAEDLEDVLNERPARHVAAARQPPLSERTMAEDVEPAAMDPLAELSALVDDALVASPPAARSAPGAGAATRRPPRVLVYGAAGLIAVVGLMAYFGPRKGADDASPAAAGSAPAKQETAVPQTKSPEETPARLIIDFEHPFRAGTLRIWVDEQLVIEKEFYGRQKKVIAVKTWSGSLEEVVDVSPGLRAVKVEVSWDGGDRLERTERTLKAGATRRLEVRVARLGKNLSLEWK